MRECGSEGRGELLTRALLSGGCGSGGGGGAGGSAGRSSRAVGSGLDYSQLDHLPIVCLGKLGIYESQTFALERAQLFHQSTLQRNCKRQTHNAWASESTDKP
jgi:hypothetical protein